jgi:type II secretory pathway component PulF
MKIVPVDVTELISELAMLLKSGISPAQALKIVQQEQEKPAMQSAISKPISKKA